jgi:ribosomal protein L34E
MSGNSFWIVMNPPAPHARAQSARCPRCGSAFDCAMHGQPFDCWCKSMPALPADRLEPGGRCLCPECLAAEIARARAGGLAGGEEG